MTSAPRSVLLRTSTKLLVPILLVLSVLVLSRGHDASGGGFVGGLLAAAGFALHSLAFGLEAARRLVRLSARLVTVVGLLVAFASGLLGLAGPRGFLGAVWTEVLGRSVGTPLLFEVAIYGVVVGVLLLTTQGLMEEAPTVRLPSGASGPPPDGSGPPDEAG